MEEDNVLTFKKMPMCKKECLGGMGGMCCGQFCPTSLEQPKKWQCTRDLGHEGPHVACSCQRGVDRADGHELCVWG